MNSSINKLVIVPGHAPFKAETTNVPAGVESDEHWCLQPFQSGEPPYYIEHIKQGVQQVLKEPRSLLIFSGGRTRADCGTWSEASTYGAIAEHFHYWTDSASAKRLTARIALEVFARDSFENLLFSRALFFQRQGFWPVHTTVVGWGFKSQRFQLHRQALHIPAGQFTYISCNNPRDVDAARHGEQKAIEQFKKDPFGEHPPLSLKRIERNPFGDEPTYSEREF